MPLLYNIIILYNITRIIDSLFLFFFSKVVTDKLIVDNNNFLIIIVFFVSDGEQFTLGLTYGYLYLLYSY